MVDASPAGVGDGVGGIPPSQASHSPKGHLVMAVRRWVVSTMASTLVAPFRPEEVNHEGDLVSVCKTSDVSVFWDPTAHGTLAPTALRRLLLRGGADFNWPDPAPKKGQARR